VPETGGVTIGVLAERIKAVQEDVHELRQHRRDDHHRLRGVEAAVAQMIEAQRLAREGEARQYKRLASAVRMAGLLVSLTLLALTVVSVLVHHG
jgi:hypothetical protein